MVVGLSGYLYKNIYYPPPQKFNSSPLKSDLPNRKVVFQPPFSGGELLNFRGEVKLHVDFTYVEGVVTRLIYQSEITKFMLNISRVHPHHPYEWLFLPYTTTISRHECFVYFTMTVLFTNVYFRPLSTSHFPVCFLKSHPHIQFKPPGIARNFSWWIFRIQGSCKSRKSWQKAPKTTKYTLLKLKNAWFT